MRTFHTEYAFVSRPLLRAHEKRLVRRNYDALVAAGLDAETMPFELFFLRYQFQGAFSWMLIVAVLDTLFADGKDDECVNCCALPSLVAQGRMPFLTALV